jgi:hypothetical protein
MGQFKPMVKMETTEPSVILKLKKGGHVSNKKMSSSSIDKAGHKKMADGGAMGALAMNPALVGRPAVNAPVAAPGKPSMAARRQAMMAKKPMPSAMMAKEGGKADMAEDKAMVKKAIKQHDEQEHKGGTGTKLKLKHGGKMNTGGVVDGQGGYKDGGIIKTKDQGGEFRNTKVVDGEKADHSPANTKGVKLGNGGGYKTGGVAKANGGGYKKGGSAKKHFATGGKVSSGAPVAMPQGRKKPSAPVAINQLSGTFKKGGKVAHKQTGGGMGFNMSDSNAGMSDQQTRAYNDHYARETADNLAMSKAVDDALLYLPRKAMEGMGYLKDKFMGKGAASDAERRAMEQIDTKGVGAISDREREASTTVIPARRRGGSIKRK